MEERPKALERVFGDTVTIRVLDFLTLAKDFDYNKSEIAEHAEVDPVSVFRIWPALEEFGIVKQTRTIQRAKMYRLNKESEIAQMLVALSDKIARFHAIGKLKEKVLAKAGRRRG